jgi:hypothetical protein
MVRNEWQQVLLAFHVLRNQKVDKIRIQYFRRLFT